jgi:ubiquinone/menaquinone biosynthesis C-methylase UbiE
MAATEQLCRYYQGFFPSSHHEANELVQLHANEDKTAFLTKYFQHEVEKGAKSVERFLKLNRDWVGGRVLDYGCGAGGLTFRLADHAKSAVGIDLEEYKIDYARQQAVEQNKQNLEFIRYDGGDVPFPDHSFDTIFCVDVMEHVPNPDHSFQEFRRLLKPGGLLLFSFGPPWGHPHGKHTWTRLPGWWTHLLFPEQVCMKVIGCPEGTTWESLGLHRLTVSKFEAHIRKSGFRQLYREDKIHRAVLPLKFVPGIRDLFISELLGIYSNPG